MLHIWQSIMLAASFTNLSEILSESVAFSKFNNFIIFFMSLELAFDKSKFPKSL